MLAARSNKTVALAKYSQCLCRGDLEKTRDRGCTVLVRMNAPHAVMNDRSDGNHLSDGIDVLVLDAELPDERLRPSRESLEELLAGFRS